MNYVKEIIYQLHHPNIHGINYGRGLNRNSEMNFRNFDLMLKMKEKIDNISLIDEKNNIIEEYQLTYNDHLLSIINDN